VNKSERGFTLIELIIFIVVVGVGVAGILSVYTTSIKSSADPLVRKQAFAIAESLLEEIVNKEYCDPDSVEIGTEAKPIRPPVCYCDPNLSLTPDPLNPTLRCTRIPQVHSGTDNEASRVSFDDVEDYNGYTTTGILDASGASISGLSNYSIAPAVQVSTTTLGGVSVKQIVVSVKGPQGAISLTGYRGNY
jgi:MSHA pilin protein MshD